MSCLLPIWCHNWLNKCHMWMAKFSLEKFRHVAPEIDYYWFFIVFLFFNHEFNWSQFLEMKKIVVFRLLVKTCIEISKVPALHSQTLTLLMQWYAVNFLFFCFRRMGVIKWLSSPIIHTGLLFSFLFHWLEVF